MGVIIMATYQFDLDSSLIISGIIYVCIIKLGYKFRQYSRTSLQQPSMGTSVLAFVESLTLFRSFSGKAHHKGGVSVITMASQVVTATELQVLEIDSYIRGYHAYTDVWVPMVGESLLVKPEPANAKDKKAVAILKETTIVGHVPHKTWLHGFSSF